MELDVNSPRSELPRRELAEFCKHWKVAELSLFGSMIRGDFGPQSDVDVLVKFDPGVCPSLIELDQMNRDLAEIFGRKVDLVERAAIESSANYIRRRHILESAEPVYVAR
jgi:predicted nucleotidyltransferase